MKNNNEQQGFVLLYALVIMIAVLSVSSTILTIYVKELKLAGIGRESTIAYYAAESGAECGLYWFLRGANFQTNGPLKGLNDHDNNPLTDPVQVNAMCSGQQVNVSGGEFTWRSDWSAAGITKPCATVKVMPGNPTVIQSRGHNTCATGVLQVERGFEIYY